MADRVLRIMLPVDNQILTVDLDDTMTSNEIIAELLAGGHVQPYPPPHSYEVMVWKGGNLVNRDAAIRDLKLGPDDVLRVINCRPAATASEGPDL